MSHKIGHASKDENSGGRGGKAGDQTGSEVYIRDWYNGNWNVVLRPKNAFLAERSAQACEAACNNANIGYDQWERNSLYAVAKEYNWDISKINVACECDCSSLMHVCAIIGGANLSYGQNAVVTQTMVDVFVNSGDYTKLTGSKYCGSYANLQRGDILVRESGHTAMFLGNANGETGLLNNINLAGLEVTEEAATGFGNFVVVIVILILAIFFGMGLMIGGLF